MVALSTCDAEYISGCGAVFQALWLVSLIAEMNLKISSWVELLVENNYAIDLAKNLVSHGRSKHIDTSFPRRSGSKRKDSAKTLQY